MFATKERGRAEGRSRTRTAGTTICGDRPLLNWLDPIVSSAVLGIALIFYCVIAWLQPNVRLQRNIANALEMPVGFATGLINGVTGSQVIPVLPYLLSLQLERNMFLQAINISFTLSSLVMAMGLWKFGLMTLQSVEVSLLGLVAVFIGVSIASAIITG